MYFWKQRKQFFGIFKFSGNTGLFSNAKENGEGNTKINTNYRKLKLKILLESKLTLNISLLGSFIPVELLTFVDKITQGL